MGAPVLISAEGFKRASVGWLETNLATHSHKKNLTIPRFRTLMGLPVQAIWHLGRAIHQYSSARPVRRVRRADAGAYVI
jgi:hypothetical protein